MAMIHQQFFFRIDERPSKQQHARHIYAGCYCISVCVRLHGAGRFVVIGRFLLFDLIDRPCDYVISRSVERVANEKKNIKKIKQIFYFLGE